MLRNPKRMGRWIVIAVAIGLFCSAETLAKKPPSPPEEPTAAELNPAIAYTQSSNKGSDVVVAAADLGSHVVLTESIRDVVSHFGSPAWSADGQFVAFWAQDLVDGIPTDMKLYVARADGSQVALVRDFTTRPGPGPSFVSDGLNWSPSGKELIHSANDNAGAILAIDAVSGDTRYLFLPTGGENFQPALSPDLDVASGYQGFLAIREHDGSVTSDGERCYDIFIVPIEDDVDGYLLPVNSTLFLNVTNKPGSSQFHPAWSPDGKSLACFDDESLAVYDATIGESFGESFTVAPNYITSVNGQDRATWTSDGWGLVFRSTDIGYGDLAISVAVENGSPINYTATRKLTEKAPAWNPMWNPDGPGGF